MNNTDDRLARLEETAYYQEQLLRELSDVLSSQQRSIDRLENEAAWLRERLLDLTLLLNSGGGLDSGPPPHYGPGR